MKKIALFVVMALVSSLSMMAAVSTDAVRVAGGDLSLVPAYEKVGDQWLDADGNAIDDMVSFVKNTCGWNAVRVRLFVEPGNDNDPATCQDIEYVSAFIPNLATMTRWKHARTSSIPITCMPRLRFRSSISR